MKLLSALAVLALLTAEPSSATGSAPPTVDESVTGKNGLPREDAMVLARLLNPEELLVELAGRSFDEAFVAGLKRPDSDLIALDRKHPGLLADLRQATRSAVMAHVRAIVPGTHRRHARFLSGYFTPAETTELAEFYRTPTGTKVVRAKFGAIDIKDMVAKVAEAPAAKVTSTDIAAMDPGDNAVWKQMTAEDTRAVLAFGLRPVARKMLAAGEGLAQIEADIANEPDPAMETAIEEASRLVFARHGVTR